MIRFIIILSALFISTTFAEEMTMEANKQFIDEYTTNEGVQKTSSGIIYRVLEKGDSDESPKPNQMVTVHYEGKLTDGTVFDSSFKRGTPAKFGLNQVIPGWTEGLQLMHKGDTFELVIPPELAYGPQGINGVIPGNSILIFKVQLLDIQ